MCWSCSRTTPRSLPPAAHALEYRFDTQAVRWRLHEARAGDRAYRFRGDRWHMMEDDDDT